MLAKLCSYSIVTILDRNHGLLSKILSSSVRFSSKHLRTGRNGRKLSLIVKTAFRSSRTDRLARRMMEKSGCSLSELQKLRAILSKSQSYMQPGSKLTYASRLLKDGKVLVTKTLEKQGNLRTAHQALLAMIQAQEPPSDTYDELFRACEDYWQKFRRKAYCFEDMRNSLSVLGQQRQEKFLDQTSSEESKDDASETNDASDRTTPALNILKLRYCFSLPVGVSKRKLETFACDALEVYRTSLKGSSPCPEAALLAAMALVRLAFVGLAKAKSAPRHDQYLLQAVFVLETCRARIKDYYPYSLLLLQIKSLLGFMSLAMKDFNGLNVKNVQWETTGHLLLTRISTSHPRSTGTTTSSEEAGIGPLRALGAALSMSSSSGESLSTQIQSGLKNGSYVNVVESVDMRLDLEHSLNKHLFIQEEARIKQLLLVPDIEDIPLRPPHLVDNRDYSYLPSYEAEGSPAFGQYLRSSPLPGERWLAAITLYNQTVRYLKGELYGHRAPSTNEIELFQTALAASSDTDVKELTDVELDNLKAHTSLASAVVAMKHPGGPESIGLNQHINGIENWLRGKVRFAEDSNEADEDTNNERHTLYFGSSLQVQAPSWTYLHRAFSLLETLQGISLFLAVLNPKSKTKSTKSKAKTASIATDKIAALQEIVEEIESDAHESARELKRELNAPGMLGRLMDIGLGRDEEQDELNPVGKVLEELVDVTSLEVLCGEMRESWEDALDGILAVKVKAK
jgi:N-terminal acetyltransferase B complex non-catalytic subunit